MFRKALVIGLGKSGLGAINFLLSKRVEVVGVDQDISLFEKREILDLKKRGVLFFSDKKSLDFGEFDVAILSPGVPSYSEAVSKVKKSGVEVIGEIELGLRFCKNKCIGITGSNGKTTVTLLTEFVLNEAGEKAKSLGNVGSSLTEHLLSATEDEIFVLELSSYQLEAMNTKILDAATILNITQNHLDRYPSFEKYALAKCSIARFLKEGSPLFLSNEILNKYFSKADNFITFEDLLANNSDLFDSLQNKRELFNVLASFGICSHFGVKGEDFFAAFKKFKKPPHRIEFVAEVNGIAFYNDSKATNIDSVIHAVEVVNKPVILIAGGADKKLSFESWNEAFLGKVKHIFAIGECAAKIKEEVKSFDVEIVSSLREAVLTAYEIAEKKDSILLSPGCSSFDMFKNYEHRGEEFKRFVRLIEKGEE